MNKSVFLNSFKSWYKLNKHRFPYPASIIKHKKGLKLLISGLTPLMEVLLFPDCEILISVNYNKEHWDFIIDFAVNESQDGKLFFCAACCSPTHFNTKEELYSAHNFEPMLCWLIENLNTENWLHLQGNQNVRFTKINNVSPDKLSKDYVFSTRLILDKKNDARSE